MVATVRVTPTATYSRRAREDLDILIPETYSCEVVEAVAPSTAPRASTTTDNIACTNTIVLLLSCCVVEALVVNGEL